MNRLHSQSLVTVAMALAVALAAGPLSAAERPGGVPGGMRQQPMSPPPSSMGRDPMSGPMQGPSRNLPTPGIAGPAGARQPVPESRMPAASVTHRGTRYLVSGGQWFEQRGADLVPVDPPANVQVQALPDGYTMRWIGGVPYFYADGLYYVWRERTRRYEIVRSPQSEEAPVVRDLRIDPAREPASATP